MIIACWSCKGGSGTSVVAASLALLSSRASSIGALAVDLGGDLPAVLGIAEPDGPGLTQWLAEPEVADDALPRLEVNAESGLALLSLGPPARDRAADSRPGRVAQLVAHLADELRPVIVDCGTIARDSTEAGRVLAGEAGLSLLVLRPCYLALRRALAAPVRPSAVVLVVEPGRALGRAEVEDVLGVPVRAEVEFDPRVSRAVDAGLLAGRLPRGLERALRYAA